MTMVRDAAGPLADAEAGSILKRVTCCIQDENIPPLLFPANGNESV
jgi:hypothetical protein